MKIKNIIDMKGLYSAHDVGEISVGVNEKKAYEALQKEHPHIINHNLAKAICAADILEVKE